MFLSFMGILFLVYIGLLVINKVRVKLTLAYLKRKSMSEQAQFLIKRGERYARVYDVAGDIASKLRLYRIAGSFYTQAAKFSQIAEFGGEMLTLAERIGELASATN